LIPFSLPGFVIDGVQMVGPAVIIDARAVRPVIACPDCQQPSSRIHSRYIRTPRDLPLSEQQVRLRLLVRRFFCSSPECPRRTFAERLPNLLPLRAQRTSRFTHALQTLGFALGGRPAARTASKLRLPVSRMTCVRVLRASAQPLFPTPDVLGVDDFAFRKGHVYGTILVDLPQRRPVDLLPDRSAETFATWLREHPGVSTIVRDRSTEYARGASEGAPQAQQVVDRWHLLVNFREAFERLLTRRHAHLCALPASQELKDQLAQRQQQQPRPLRQPSAKEAVRRQARRAQRYARYEQVRALHDIGLPLTQIAKRLGISWTTARDFASADTFPERAATKPRASQIDRFAAYLEQRWAAGCTNASQLWREVQERGYTGTRKQVAHWAEHQRTKPAPTTPTKDRTHTGTTDGDKVYPSTRLPSPRELVWVMLREVEQLETTEKLLLEHLCCDGVMANAYDLAQSFQTMVRQRQADQFDSWLQACSGAEAAELKNFATSLRREESAIRAALTEVWSTGPVEGQITRLKSIKRQMYGRASFDLLRRRVLQAA
jgi:transposase